MRHADREEGHVLQAADEEGRCGDGGEADRQAAADAAGQAERFVAIGRPRRAGDGPRPARAARSRSGTVAVSNRL